VCLVVGGGRHKDCFIDGGVQSSDFEFSHDLDSSRLQIKLAHLVPAERLVEELVHGGWPNDPDLLNLT